MKHCSCNICALSIIIYFLSLFHFTIFFFFCRLFVLYTFRVIRVQFTWGFKHVFESDLYHLKRENVKKKKKNTETSILTFLLEEKYLWLTCFKVFTKARKERVIFYDFKLKGYFQKKNVIINPKQLLLHILNAVFCHLNINSTKDPVKENWIKYFF